MRVSGVFVWALVVWFTLGAWSLRPAGATTLAPGYPGRDWHRADDAAAWGWSPAKLAEARQVAAAIGSAAVLVVQRGRVIAAWGDMAHKYRCHSMRKSLVSALFGIARAHGEVDLGASLAELDIDDRPPALSPVEKQATVEHLLQARSGVYHRALSESPEMKARRPARHSHRPGSFWYYNNWDFNALGTIYEDRCGRGVFEAFHTEIAEQIGMQDYAPADGRYRTGPASIHPTYQFRMSTRDLARFGLLFLRQGRWRNRQVVPAEWVAASTRAHSSVGFRQGYGYMWWTLDTGSRLPNVRIPESAYYAAGYRGHRMYLFPERDLIIVHRVNTDLPQVGDWSGGQAPVVDNHRLGRLLWKLLDAAGIKGIGPDPSWAAAPGTPLDGEAVRALLLGKSIDMEGGLRFSAYADGRCAIFRQGEMLEAGRWWVTDDLFCSRWKGDGGGGLRRYRLALEGRTVRRYEADGTLMGVGRLVE